MSAISTAVPCAIDARTPRCAGGAAATRTRQRWCVAAATAALLAYVTVFDPHSSHRFLPPCPLKLVTGLDCPACGGVRLSYDLLHRDMRAAVQDNVFLLLASPILAILAWRALTASPRTGAHAVPDPAAYTIAAAGLSWMVVRNLPGFPLKPIVRGDERRARRAGAARRS